MAQTRTAGRGGRHPRRRRSPARRQAPIGAAPGTLQIDPEARASQVAVTRYDAGHYDERTEVDVAALGDRPAPGAGVEWLSVVGLGTESVLRAVADRYHLHPLALEDVVNTHQRPKVEEYGDHIYIVLRMPLLGETLEVGQLSIFLGPNFVVTFQQEPSALFEPMRERLQFGRGRARREGPDFLAYGLLDAVVDSFFPVLDAYARRMDDLEEAILDDRIHDALPRLLDIKRDLQQLRRGMHPLRDTLRFLVGGATELVAPETVPYIRDATDHVVQAVDQLETLREVQVELVSIHLSVSSQRLNEVMKVLTIFATIFMPLGFIAGLYGMNFDSKVSPWNMPELGWYWGYPFALGLMALAAAGLVAFVWRRGWLRSP